MDVAPHLDEHDWPRDSRPHEFSDEVQSLAAHVVVERCEDIRLQSTWKDELFHSASMWVLRAAIQPSLQEETRMLLE